MSRDPGATESFTVELALDEDQPRVGELWLRLNQLHEEFGEAWRLDENAVEMFLTGLTQSLKTPHVFLWVARAQSGELFGYCHGLIRSNPRFWAEKRVGSIVSIMVAPEARGLGVGRQLVEAAMQEFQKRGLPRVETLVSRRNSGALRFWESVEFSDHAIVLSRDLPTK